SLPASGGGGRAVPAPNSLPACGGGGRAVPAPNSLPTCGEGAERCLLQTPSPTCAGGAERCLFQTPSPACGGGLGWGRPQRRHHEHPLPPAPAGGRPDARIPGPEFIGFSNMTDPREAGDTAGWGLGTKAIHAGQAHDPSTGAVMPPIYATSTYAQSSPGEHQGFEYSRTHDPTRFAWERGGAEMEAGSRGVAFTSGIAATATVLEMLDSGDHVLAMEDIYGGSYRLFERVRRRSAGLDFGFVDMTDLAAFEAA